MYWIPAGFPWLFHRQQDGFAGNSPLGHAEDHHARHQRIGPARTIAWPLLMWLVQTKYQRRSSEYIHSSKAGAPSAKHATGAQFHGFFATVAVMTWREVSRAAVEFRHRLVRFIAFVAGICSHHFADHQQKKEPLHLQALLLWAIVQATWGGRAD